MSARADKALAVARGLVEGPRDLHERAMAGVRDGVAVSFECGGLEWVVTAELSGPPLALDARREAAGTPPDGAPALDGPLPRLFFGRGARAGLARALLDRLHREQLMALEPCRLDVAPTTVRLRKGFAYYGADPAHIDSALALCVSLAHRAKILAEAAEQERLRTAPRAGGPYRGDPVRSARATAGSPAATQRGGGRALVAALVIAAGLAAVLAATLLLAG